MTTILHFIAVHQTSVSLFAAWLGSNIVTSLPSPTNQSNGFYKFIFALLHGLAGSIARVFPSLRVFNDPTQGSKTYFGNTGSGK